MNQSGNKTNKEIAESLNVKIKGIEFHITKIPASLQSSLKGYYIVYSTFFAV